MRVVKYPCLLRAFAALIVVLLQPGCGQQSKLPAPEQSLDDRIAAENARMRAAKWNVRVDVLIVEVPEAKAMELLPDLRSDDPQKIAGAVAQIQQMIGAKEATLISWPEVVCLDGARAVTETIAEKRYPVTFELPQLPTVEPVPETTTAITPAPNATAPTPAPPESETAAVDSTTIPLPTSFETRNVGVTLEAEANVIDDGRRLVLSAVAEHVRLAGYMPFDYGTESDPLTIEQPEFNTTKATTTVSIRNGQHVLLNMHKLGGEKETVELFILHAVASKVE